MSPPNNQDNVLVTAPQTKAWAPADVYTTVTATLLLNLIPVPPTVLPENISLGLPS